MEGNSTVRINQNISDSLRDLIIRKYESGDSITQIALELHFKYTTIQSILRKYKTKGEINSSKKNCGRKKKISEDERIIIRDLIEEDCSVTLKKIQEKVFDVASKTVSVSLIHREITNFEFSFKRVQLIPERRNEMSNIETRFSFARQIMTLEVEKLIYIDEFGVNCGMRKRYGRAPIGETPRKSVTTVRSKNFSVCAAMRKEGLISFKIQEEAYNRETFFNFIRDLILQITEMNLKNMTFIFDNVPFHKMNSIKEIIISSGNFLLFLPPYSPQLNPIEEAFSAWKEGIRSRNCQNKDDLCSAIHAEANRITTEACIGFFRHMNFFLIKAIAKEEF